MLGRKAASRRRFVELATLGAGFALAAPILASCALKPPAPPQREQPKPADAKAALPAQPPATEDAAEISKATSLAAPFYAGKVALHWRLCSDIGQALQSVGDRFKWDVIWAPGYRGKPCVSEGNGHGNSIWAKTKVPDEAYQWIKWIGATPGMTPVSRTRLQVPIYRRDPNLRKLYETPPPEHINVVIDALEVRGGYGDHMRFNNEGELRAEFQKRMQLLYARPYDEARKELGNVLKTMESDLNGMVNYGPELPFTDVKFPFPPQGKKP